MFFSSEKLKFIQDIYFFNADKFEFIYDIRNAFATRASGKGIVHFESDII